MLAGLCSEVCFQDGTLFLHSHRTKEQRDQIMDEAVKKINILDFIYEVRFPYGPNKLLNASPHNTCMGVWFQCGFWRSHKHSDSIKC